MASGFRNDLVDNFSDGYGVPVSQLDVNARLSFLKKTYGLTFLALFVATLSAAAAVGFIFTFPQIAFAFSFLPIIIMLGAMFLAHFVCAGMVQSSSKSTKYAGLFLANFVEGIALAYLIVYAMIQAAGAQEHPLLIVGQALGVTFLTVLGITGYVYTTKNDYSWARSILAAMFLPMIFMMVMMVFFPIGGIFGILFSAVFVGISAIGLLVSTNDVIHHLDEDQSIEGAFVLSMGILILFWNILSLLMKLQRN